MTGSSPRMRGTRARYWYRGVVRGIIPAYAGNTVLDHLDQQFVTGSSPRMRGTPAALSFDGTRLGIIPAYAGNTDGVFYVPGTVWDHPRVCGEHTVSMVVYATMLGSSPRMRGTLGSQLCLSVGVGIIPAYAGNTSWLPPVENWSGDHPRVCGEHLHGSLPSMGTSGSSPRMRGTLGDCLAGFFRHGIIPAYAGNTGLVRRGHGRSGDHPRVCGEHPLPSNEFYQSPGSSPRMRGTRQRGRSA